MSLVMQINPFEYFTDLTGSALNEGYVWIGQPNKDPRSFPVPVFFDEALTIPAALPLRTNAGYIVRGNAPTFLFINGNYSVLVQDKKHRQIFYVADFLMTGNSAAVSLGDLANNTTPGKGASMVGDLGGTTVQAFIDFTRANNNIVIGSANIVAAIAAGGEVEIANGGHYMMATAICDYAADPEVGFAGNPSKRYNIFGKSPGGTILSIQHNDYAIQLLGSFPVTQNFGGFDAIGNLTLVGQSVTTPNTTNTGGLGLFIQTKAYTNVYRFIALNLRRGLHLDGVLTSTIEDVTIDGCYEGLVSEDTNNTAGPNAMNFRRIKIGGATSYAARLELGASTQFDNLTIEGCGTMGSIIVASLWQSKIGSIAVVVNLNSVYYELNAGPADLYISHVAAQDMVMNINGGLFHRTTTGRYTNTNLLLRSEPGAGRVLVKLSGVKFHGSFGYIPLNTRPYFDVGARCEVVWDNACQFTEMTSMNYWLCLDMDYTFVISAAGAILSGPIGFSCAKVSTGVYRIARTLGKAEFSKFADDYSISVTTTAPASNGYLSNRQTTLFEVTLDNGAVVADAPFSVTIKRVAGYYP